MFASFFGRKSSPLNLSQISTIDAKTQNFKNALTAYKNAIGNLTANANIYAKLNNVINKNGKKYNEKLLRAIAKAFYQSEKAAVAVNSLKSGAPGAPEGPATQAVTAAANAVNEVAARIELNKAMKAYVKLNNNNVNAYIASGRNASKNNLLNKNRTEGGKYGNFFTRVASRKITKAGVNKALAAQPPAVVSAVGNSTTRGDALLQLGGATPSKNYILNQLIRNKTKNNKIKLNAIVNSIKNLNPGSQATQYMILRGRSGKNPNRAQQKLNRAARPNRGNLWTALGVPSNE